MEFENVTLTSSIYLWYVFGNGTLTPALYLVQVWKLTMTIVINFTFLDKTKLR